jgi:hypothetical protein
MNIGTKVMVKAYPNKELERLVLKEAKSYILVCREEVFKDALIHGDSYPNVMGFPKEDVRVV